jgi:hypothetical protein
MRMLKGLSVMNVDFNRNIVSTDVANITELSKYPQIAYASLRYGKYNFLFDILVHGTFISSFGFLPNTIWNNFVGTFLSVP